LYVCLTHSKFFNALVFPYLVVILYVNDLYIFRFLTKQSSLSVSLRICECKSKTLFLIDQMFWKKILKFFLSNLNLFPKLSITHSCAPCNWDCKDTNSFLTGNLFCKKFWSFFRLFLFEVI